MHAVAQPIDDVCHLLHALRHSLSVVIVSVEARCQDADEDCDIAAVLQQNVGEPDALRTNAGLDLRTPPADGISALSPDASQPRRIPHHFMDARNKRSASIAHVPGAPTGPPKFYVAALLGEETAREIVRRRSRKQPDSPVPRELSGNVGFLQAWMQLRNRIRRIGDESHGFAPAPVRPGQFDLHLAIMCHGANTAHALKRFIGASRLLRPDFHIQSRRTRRTLELTVRLKGPGDPVREIYHEIYAVVIHCALRWVTGERVQILRVRAAPAPAGVSLTFVSTLGCPITRSGRGVTLIYPASAADIPVVPAKLGRWGSVVVDQFVRELKQMHHVSAATRIETPTTDRVRQVLAMELLSEPALARRFGLSTATLRRRLTDEGTSFRDIAMATRRRLAQALLTTDRSIAEVATELGFSDDRSFRRACHQWFGVSPAAYREAASRESGPPAERS